MQILFDGKKSDEMKTIKEMKCSQTQKKKARMSMNINVTETPFFSFVLLVLYCDDHGM